MTWCAALFSPCSPKTLMSHRGLFATFGTLYRLGVLPIASMASMSSGSSVFKSKFSSMRDLVTLCARQLGNMPRRRTFGMTETPSRATAHASATCAGVMLRFLAIWTMSMGIPRSGAPP